MEIVVIWGVLGVDTCIPCWKRYIGYRSWGIPLGTTSIVWILLFNHGSNKSWSTLLLSLTITNTDCCIRSHRHTLSDSLLENTCYNRLIDINSLFALHDRCEDEFFICIFSDFSITLSHSVLESCKELEYDFMRGCIFGNSICIWIEESLETINLHKPIIF